MPNNIPASSILAVTVLFYMLQPPMSPNNLKHLYTFQEINKTTQQQPKVGYFYPYIIFNAGFRKIGRAHV